MGWTTYAVVALQSLLGGFAPLRAFAAQEAAPGAPEPAPEPAPAATLAGIEDEAARLLGFWVAEEAVLGVRWVTLGASLAVLVAACAADLILRLLVRRKIRRDEAAAAAVPEHEREARSWVDRGLRAAVPPLAFLIWVQALHLALTILAHELYYREAADFALGALDWLRGAATLLGIFWLLSRIGRLAEAALTAMSGRGDSTWDAILLPVAGKAVRLMLPFVALILGAPMLAVSPELQALVQNGVSLLLIGTVAFLLLQLVEAAEALVLRQHRIDVADNLQARQIHTQVMVLKRVAFVVIGLFTLASMLMVFESVRQFGTSILASAGIAGLVIGFAAQRSIATLVAGFQIAVTQPIRLDDVVIVENEWGRIEDITLTYVVVRIWDERRLILPITYFIEQPFQNWTRTSADILGSVFVYVDYTVPLPPLRAELERIVRASPHWDGKVQVLQVTDSREHTLELRALASAADASSAWDLRCEIREKLVDYLQRHHPESLPRVRAAVQPGTAVAM